MAIPAELAGQKYISLATFRKSGVPVATAVWFAEEGPVLYVVTRKDAGKLKRIRNNGNVKVAPCTIRGKVTGPESSATARILPEQDWPHARKVVGQKYWLHRLSFSKNNAYLEISFPG